MTAEDKRIKDDDAGLPSGKDDGDDAFIDGMLHPPLTPEEKAKGHTPPRSVNESLGDEEFYILDGEVNPDTTVTPAEVEEIQDEQRGNQ